MAEETKSDTTYYPSFCAIQNDWECALTNNDKTENQFWISLIQHNKNQNKRCYVDAMVNIGLNKKNQLIPNLTLKKTNNDTDSKQNDNLDWNLNIIPFNDDNKKYYAQITCAENNLNNYNIIPSYNEITNNNNTKVSINCLDIAKSSYFKRWYICAGLQDGNINIYDVESAKLKMICTGDSQYKTHITQCKFFPFGDLILSGDTNGILNIYAIADPKGKPAVSFEGHKGDISCIDFIGQGSEILSGSRDNTVILWDCSTQKQVIQFGKLGLSTINQISAGSAMNNDKILTTVCSDGYLRFYDIKDGKEIVNIKACNGDGIECFCSLNNNNCIMVASDNGVCCMYDIRKLNANKINCIGRIQRDEKCISKIIKCYHNENELILCNPGGSIWKWSFDMDKDVDVNNVCTVNEWTGNDQFGVNDFVITDNNSMYVATKNYKIKQYLLK